MIFKSKKHNTDLYNTLLLLSRNVFFYNKLKFSDSFETRIYLIFIHFSIMMIIFKKKGSKFEQKSYDFLFLSIENNLRELGFGDVAVNKKMKDLNKILYDILLKIEQKDEVSFKINKNLIIKYFKHLNDTNNDFFQKFERYLVDFYNFCFELPLENMVIEAKNFKYGST